MLGLSEFVHGNRLQYLQSWFKSYRVIIVSKKQFTTAHTKEQKSRLFSGVEFQKCICAALGIGIFRLGKEYASAFSSELFSKTFGE